MQITVTIHEAWLTRADEFRRIMALLAGLEIPPPGPAAEPHDPREDLVERFDPEERAPARSRWTAESLTPLAHPGDDDEAQARDDEDQDAPSDGRQLMGWARKQDPDALGTILSYGKRNRLKSKIVDWTPDQVNAAYRFARAQQAQPRR